MEKLLHIRNVQLVRVNGELVAAGKLAGRKASFSEATERLELLQELAGKFRRTQESIEDMLDDMESIATARKVVKEFEAAYQAAKQLLENYVTHTTPVRAVPAKASNGNLQDEIRRFCEEVKEWNKEVVGQLGAVPGGAGELDRYHPSNCVHLGPTTTTTEILSGAVGCGDPEGKQLPSCAPILGPTVAPVMLAGGETTSNWLPLLEEHRPSIGVTTFYPGQASCSDDKDGPETSTGEVAKVSAAGELGTYRARAHPGHSKEQHAVIEAKMSIESGGAQQKTHILSTDLVSIPEIHGSLHQAALQLEERDLSDSSGNLIHGERSGVCLTSHQLVKECVGVLLELGTFCGPLVPWIQSRNFKGFSGNGQAEPNTNWKQKSRNPRHKQKQATRTKDSRFREQRELQIKTSSGSELFRETCYRRQVPVDAGEGKGLLLKVLHTKSIPGAVQASESLDRVASVRKVKADDWVGGLSHGCLKAREDVPVTRTHIRVW